MSDEENVHKLSDQITHQQALWILPLRHNKYLVQCNSRDDSMVCHTCLS